ncbi:MAG: ATP-binding protein, partial [Nocardioidaceae bacterium]
GGAVLPAIARVVGVSLEGDEPAHKVLAGHIADKRMLLFLDNFEQVRGGALPVAELLNDCPELSVVITSRRLLDLQDEHEYAVPPMGLPQGSSLIEIRASEAVQLFVEHARRSRHGLELTGENAAAVAQVCTLLDGLPLAIELAAARARLFSPEALVSRLGDRLGLLTSGARDLPERHRTLRAAVDWSYALLREPERRAFLDLAVFSGGARPESIEAVIDSGQEVLDLVTALVEHSLVNHNEDADGEPRFSMLQTLRDYAVELLLQAPDHYARVRERHAQHYLALAEDAMPPGQPLTRRSAQRVEQDHDNVHAALAFWLDERRDPDAGSKALQLAVALGEYWYRHGQSREGADWLEGALAAAHDTPPATRARALRALGRMHEQRREPDRATEVLTEAMRLNQQLGDRAGEAECLYTLGLVARSAGRPDHAQDFLRRAVAIRRELGDQAGVAPVLNDLALVHLDQGRWLEARSVLAGNLVADRPATEEQEAGEASDADAGESGVSESERGRPVVLEAMIGFLRMADVDGVVETIESSVGLAVARGQWLAAVRLAGAAKAARRRLGLAESPAGRAQLESRLAEAREHLGTAAFEAAQHEGAALTYEQATSYLISEVLET